jgi:glucosylceramidase
MILDQTAKSYWGWKQNSLISINKQTKAVIYNPEFYLIKHISHFVIPGAHYLMMHHNVRDILAFLNPGENQVVIINNNDTDFVSKRPFRINDTYFIAEFPSRSINSVMVQV